MDIRGEGLADYELAKYCSVNINQWSRLWKQKIHVWLVSNSTGRQAFFTPWFTNTRGEFRELSSRGKHTSSGTGETKIQKGDNLGRRYLQDNSGGRCNFVSSVEGPIMSSNKPVCKHSKISPFLSEQYISLLILAVYPSQMADSERKLSSFWTKLSLNHHLILTTTLGWIRLYTPTGGRQLPWATFDRGSVNLPLPPRWPPPPPPPP